MNAATLVGTVVAALAGVAVGAIAFGPKSAYAKSQAPSGPAGKWLRLAPSADGYYSVPPGATFYLSMTHGAPAAVPLSAVLLAAAGKGDVLDLSDQSGPTRPATAPSDEPLGDRYRAEGVVSPSESAPLQFTQARDSSGAVQYLMWQWVPA